MAGNVNYIITNNTISVATTGPNWGTQDVPPPGQLTGDGEVDLGAIPIGMVIEPSNGYMVKKEYFTIGGVDADSGGLYSGQLYPGGPSGVYIRSWEDGQESVGIATGDDEPIELPDYVERVIMYDSMDSNSPQFPIGNTVVVLAFLSENAPMGNTSTLVTLDIDGDAVLIEDGISGSGDVEPGDDSATGNVTFNISALPKPTGPVVGPQWMLELESQFIEGANISTFVYNGQAWDGPNNNTLPSAGNTGAVVIDDYLYNAYIESSPMTTTSSPSAYILISPTSPAATLDAANFSVDDFPTIITAGVNNIAITAPGTDITTYQMPRVYTGYSIDNQSDPTTTTDSAINMGTGEQNNIIEYITIENTTQAGWSSNNVLIKIYFYDYFQLPSNPNFNLYIGLNGVADIAPPIEVEDGLDIAVGTGFEMGMGLPLAPSTVDFSVDLIAGNNLPNVKTEINVPKKNAYMLVDVPQDFTKTKSVTSDDRENFKISGSVKAGEPTVIATITISHDGRILNQKYYNWNDGEIIEDTTAWIPKAPTMTFSRNGRKTLRFRRKIAESWTSDNDKNDMIQVWVPSKYIYEVIYTAYSTTRVSDGIKGTVNAIAKRRSKSAPKDSILYINSINWGANKNLSSTGETRTITITGQPGARFYYMLTKVEMSSYQSLPRDPFTNIEPHNHNIIVQEDTIMPRISAGNVSNYNPRGGEYGISVVGSRMLTTTPSVPKNRDVWSVHMPKSGVWSYTQQFPENTSGVVQYYYLTLWNGTGSSLLYFKGPTAYANTQNTNSQLADQGVWGKNYPTFILKQSSATRVLMGFNFYKGTLTATNLNGSGATPVVQSTGRFGLANSTREEASWVPGLNDKWTFTMVLVSTDGTAFRLAGGRTNADLIFDPRAKDPFVKWHRGIDSTHWDETTRMALPEENGGTEFVVKNLNITGLETVGPCTLSCEFYVTKWGDSPLTPSLDLSSILVKVP